MKRSRQTWDRQVTDALIRADIGNRVCVDCGASSGHMMRCEPCWEKEQKGAIIIDADALCAPLEWVGSICGIVSDIDPTTPDIYSVGDREPCCLCDSPVERSCTASVQRQRTATKRSTKT